MLHSCPTLTFKPMVSLLPILYLLLLLPHHCPFLLAIFLCLLLPLFPDSSGFFNGMLEIFEPGALNCYTFFCPISLTLSVSRNPSLTHLPLSGSLHSLLCILIAPTSVWHSLSRCHARYQRRHYFHQAYLSLNFLPPLTLRLTLTLIM